MAVTSGTTSAGRVQGNSDGATKTYLLPVYTHTGAAVAATVHAVYDTVTAPAGVSTSVVFSSSTAAPFSAVPIVHVVDVADGTIATMTASATTGFSFTSVATHVYHYFAIGI